MVDDTMDDDERRFAADEHGDHPEPWTPGPDVTPELFREWRSPRDGTGNPEVLTNPVWQWLVRTRISAYRANEHFDGPSPFEAGPGWSCERFGQSCTRLPDGRLVRIGGEHEDGYDPDFHIYNDVIVRAPDGSLAIFGYPRAVFPPTDFHTATLVGDRIVVIGCLGHADHRRAGVTPVFAFDTRTWACSSVPTSGPSPGWIHRHAARLESDGLRVVVTGGEVHRSDDEPFAENFDDWRLDLDDGRWHRLTARQWPQCVFVRRDGRWNNLSALRSACEWRRWPTKVGEELLANDLARLTEALGGPPDLDLAESLYRPRVPHDVVAETEGEYGVRRVQVDGVTLRFVAEIASVRLVVEGDLARDTVDAIVGEFRDKLVRLERCDYDVRRL